MIFEVEVKDSKGSECEVIAFDESGILRWQIWSETLSALIPQDLLTLRMLLTKVYNDKEAELVASYQERITNYFKEEKELERVHGF